MCVLLFNTLDENNQRPFCCFGCRFKRVFEPVELLSIILNKDKVQVKKFFFLTIDRKYCTNHKPVESVGASDEIILFRLVVAAFFEYTKDLI